MRQYAHVFLDDMRLQHGAILISVLLLLFAVSLLGLAAMDTAVIETKMSADARQKTQAMTAAENGLMAAQQALLIQSDLPCVQPAQISEFYLQQTTHWWLSAINCQGQFQQQRYAYLVNFINRDDCFYQPFIEEKDVTPPQGAEFYRIIVWAPAENSQISSVIEATFIRGVKTAAMPLSCDSTTLFVPRLLSWWILR